MDGVSLRRQNGIVTAIFASGDRPVYGYRIAPSPERLTIRSIDPRTRRDEFSIVKYDKCSTPKNPT